MKFQNLKKTYRPLISIIIPIYNVEKYLPACLDSVINQTYNNTEIILINDGSKDNSSDIANKFVKQHDNIILINQKNKGQSVARNAGLEIAKGDWLVFVDSDDIISLKFVQTMLETNLRNNTKLCAARMTRNLNYLDKGKGKTNKVLEGSSYIDLLDKFYNSEYTPIGAWGKMYHRSLFDFIRYPIGIIYEDGVTYFEIMSNVNKISLIDTNLYYYRVVPSSTLHAAISQKNFDIFKKNRLIEEWMKSNYPYDINYAYKFNENYNNRTAIEALKGSIKGQQIAKEFLIELKNDNKKYSLLLNKYRLEYKNIYFYSIYLCILATQLYFRKTLKRIMTQKDNI